MTRSEGQDYKSCPSVQIYRGNFMIKCDAIILDSGIAEDDFKKYANNIVGTKIIGDYEDVTDLSGHGTAVLNIILSHVPEAKIFIIKILDENLQCDETYLIEALKYVFDNVEGKVLNLSLGITSVNNISELYNICQKISQKGISIISAFDNDGAISYPAAFDCVYGVDSSYDLPHKDDFYIMENSSINILAKGCFNRVKWKNGYIFLSGTSFSTANISGIILNAYRKLSSVNLNKFLQEKAIKKITISKPIEISKCPDIKCAIILPYNKEVHSIINFSSLLNFDIEGVYDFRLSGNVGRRVKSLFENGKQFLIRNYNDIPWESGNFETIILGHLNQISNIMGYDILKIITEKARRYSKQIVSFDSLYSINDENVVNQNCDKLYIINSPVLGIFGTSSKQGKFTLQLLLRKKFLEKGYKIGQLGTEPNSELFGMDEVYPMGFNSGVHISGYKSILYLNQLMNKIDLKSPDLIIVGSQSGTSTYWRGNLKQYPVRQIEFLMGTLPDAVILCVNTFDDIEYIRRTINTIEGLIETKVIALVVYPFEYICDWHMIMNKLSSCSPEKIDYYKSSISKKIGLPCFDMNNERDIESLIVLCETFFS